MARSDHQRRLTALEAQMTTAVEAAKEAIHARLEVLLGMDDYLTLARYFSRLHSQPATTPTHEEAGLIERYEWYVTNDSEVVDITNKYSIPQTMLEWGKAWHGR